MSIHTPSQSGQTLQAAISASANGSSFEAIRLFLQAIAEEPGSGVPHFLLGAEYAAVGRYEEAEASFANAVLIAPHLTMARYQLGLLQFSSGRAAMALLTWQPLLALSEDDPLTHLARGFEQLAHDEFGRAREFFESGMARNTTNPALSADITLVLREIERRVGQAGENHSDSSVGDAEAGMDSSHVLLSNYKPQGMAH